MSRLKERYKKQIRGELEKKYNHSNSMTIPSVCKVVINMGVAEAMKDKNALQDATKELTLLSGQKPLVTRARKSIAGFKLRQGQPIGLKVTLRGIRMYDFMDRFFNIVCPRIRDFRGFKPKCDGQGNYTLGIEEQVIFPEINLDDVKRTQGMHITFVTDANSDEECIELLRLLGLPFKDHSVVIA